MNTRFRPTPYRDLHLGHVWTYWHNWTRAKQQGGDCVLIADDIVYNLQFLHQQSWSPEVAVERFVADLTWLGMPPDRIEFSSNNAATHAEAAEFLGIKPCGRIGDVTFDGPQIRETMRDAWELYHPWFVLVRVVDDHTWLINEFVRGMELIGEVQLYDWTYRQLYGGNPPLQKYVPVVRRAASTQKESKHTSSPPVWRLRDAGYTPREIIGTLREAAAISEEQGLRDVVIPEGVLDPETHQTLPRRHGFAAYWQAQVLSQSVPDNQPTWYGQATETCTRVCKRLRKAEGM